jgi:hypothetical protein
LEDCYSATVIPVFEKVKVWGARHYGVLSKLVVMLEKEGQGKLNALEYTAIVLDGELLDFQMRSMEEEGYILVMQDGTLYHKGAVSLRRK